MIPYNKKFNFDFEIDRIDSETGRLYRINNDKAYPSVTTILGKTADHSYLIEWEKRVGKEEAARNLKAAGIRGTRVHNYLEKFIEQNGVVDNRKENPFTLHLAMPVVKFLNDNVKEFWHSEVPVYSEKFKFAGTCDCVALLKDGTISIIDFKTANNMKTEDMIGDYFLQCAAYALAIKELTGIFINKTLIVMISESCNEPKSFEVRNKDHILEFLKRRKEFDNVR